MSKQGKRKILVELPKVKELAARPSVFERLGTKRGSCSIPSAPTAPPATPLALAPPQSCRQWAQTGTCPYGKACKFAETHVLISPSKQRAAIKETELKSKDDTQSRLHSTVVVRSGRSPGEWDQWDQNDLEYADADVLEKRRQQLQRELEKQLKMDSSKDHRKDKKRPVTSSSSSRSSSTTSVTSSSSGATTSSSSSARDSRKKMRKNKPKRNSSSSSDSDRISKKKRSKSNLSKRDRSTSKRSALKKDNRGLKKQDIITAKKKNAQKMALSKKSLSPAKKAGGTPPINSKNVPKGYLLTKHNTQTPMKKDKKSISPHQANKEREKERERERERLREKEKERERDRDREREKERRRSKSPRSKARSRSPIRRHGSHGPRDPRRRESSTRSRGSSPKKRSGHGDSSLDRHRSKVTPSRDDRKEKDYRDRSLERRKDKHDDKDKERKDRLARDKEREEALARCQERQRERERLKEQNKRDQEKRNIARGRTDRDRGLQKPTPDKPVERLLPRPEERLAALAATNRSLGLERAMSSNRDRTEPHAERGVRKNEPSVDRDRIDRVPKRHDDRRPSLERGNRNDYNRGIDNPFDHSRSMDRNYDRQNERYEDMPRDRSPGAFPAQRSGEHHYDSPYDMQGSHSRDYGEPEDPRYEDHIDDHHMMERGFDDRRNMGHRDEHGWDNREASIDQERQYMHHGHPVHKEWENEEYGDWNRQDRHWQPRNQHQVHEWGDKEREIEGGWHPHRQPVAGNNMRGRMHEDGNYRGRMEHRMDQGPPHTHQGPPLKRAHPMQRENVKEPLEKVSAPAAPVGPHGEGDDAAVPDDLSEISDDADEILNREEEIAEVTEPTNTTSKAIDTYEMIDFQQFRPDYEPMIEQDAEKPPPKIAVETETPSPVKKEPAPIAPEIKPEPNHDQNDAEDGLDSLDFEEISDGELEEEQKVKGLDDALGVDWASFVAEVRKKKDKNQNENETSKQTAGIRQYWQPKKILARIGVSVYMAGEDMIDNIFNSEDKEIKIEGQVKQEEKKATSPYKPAHPIASIQVAMERRKKQRLSLFGTANGFTRALSARQDLALRRHLCNLPINECGHEIHPPDPQLFAMAQKLLESS